MKINSALVVGGGFAGSSTAAVLARAGIDVDLVEINPQWTTYGAGISIGGPTLRALNALGVLDRFLEEGYGCDGTDILTVAGDPVAQLPTPRIVAPEIPGNGAVMRPVLGRILADAAVQAGARVRLGVTADEFIEDETGIDVSFTDGIRRRYDLVVAADGLYSKLRQRFFPDAPTPRYNGQGVWRAVLPRPDDVVRTMLWMGEDVKVGLNPVSEEEMYLFVNENCPVSERVPNDVLVPRLRALLAPFTDPRVQRARAAIGEDSLVVYRPIEGMLVPLPWHRGRIVMVGDVVHATTPHLAAGAGIGIEDALVLGAELAAARTLDDALTAFGKRRFERCRMVVENSGRLGEIETSHGDQGEHTRLMGESFHALTQPV